MFKLLSSPHTRGCFSECSRSNHNQKIFPAYAGVFPSTSKCPAKTANLPRIRGGVSNLAKELFVAYESSPHTRGCFCSSRLNLQYSFIFPAYAGVFLRRAVRSRYCLHLPRIRGGVSLILKTSPIQPISSPHTRGCFPSNALTEFHHTIFPAYAGVFPLTRRPPLPWWNLPRIRGGVSPAEMAEPGVLVSSPHTRGCFPSAKEVTSSGSIFPAYAGVFP